MNWNGVFRQAVKQSCIVLPKLRFFGPERPKESAQGASPGLMQRRFPIEVCAPMGRWRNRFNTGDAITTERAEAMLPRSVGAPA